MFGRTFSEEDDTAEGNGTSSPAEVEYTFEGFNIEFSEKVVLTPPGMPKVNRRKGEPRSDG
jgi:hypothetical protein